MIEHALEIDKECHNDIDEFVRQYSDGLIPKDEADKKVAIRIFDYLKSIEMPTLIAIYKKEGS